MEIVKERNYSTLIGEFTAIEYEGSRTNLITFKDIRYGSFAVGVYKEESIELNVPYQINVSLRGKVKAADRKLFISNCLYLVSYEKRQSNETEQTKTDQLKGDKQ